MAITAQARRTVFVDTFTDGLIGPEAAMAGPVADGGPATRASLSTCGTSVDAAGNLVIADVNANRLHLFPGLQKPPIRQLPPSTIDWARLRRARMLQLIIDEGNRSTRIRHAHLHGEQPCIARRQALMSQQRIQFQQHLPVVLALQQNLFCLTHISGKSFHHSQVLSTETQLLEDLPILLLALSQLRVNRHRLTIVVERRHALP